MKARGGSAALAAMLRQRTETTAPPEVVQKSRRQSVTETENTAAATAVAAPAAPKPPAPAPAAAPAPPKPAAPVRPPAPAIIPPAPKDASQSLPRTTSFSAAQAGPPKCCVCEKSVYKVEEVQALGRAWHDKCFRCGGRQPVGENPGCGKVLRRDGYLDHHHEPFCTACYNKLYRPKGFGFGNTLSTDYGPVAGSESNNSSNTSTAPAVSAESAATVTTAAAPVSVPPPPAPPAPTAPVAAPVAAAPAVDVPAASSAAASAPTKPAPPAWLRKTPSQSQTQAPALAQPAPPAAAPAAPVAPAVPAASITIGASSRAPKASSLHVEAKYVGDNDEVDESEWD